MTVEEALNKPGAIQMIEDTCASVAIVDVDMLSATVIEKVWKYRRQFNDKGDSSFKRWVYRIAKNAAIDQTRSKHVKNTLVPIMENHAQDCSYCTESAHDLNVVMELVEQKFPSDVVMFEKVVIEGHSTKDVAEFLGIKKYAVTNRLKEMRNWIRDSFSEDWDMRLV